MIEKTDIKNRINIIFQHEQDNLNSGIFFNYVDTSYSEMDYQDALIEHDDILRAEGFSLHILETKPKTIEWDTFSTLKQFYHSIETDRESRSFFIKEVINKLLSYRYRIRIVKGLPRESSSLSFYFLMKIGEVHRATSALCQYFEKYHKNTYLRQKNGLLNDIYIFMSMESIYFDDWTLLHLKILNNSCSSFAGCSKLRKNFELEINNRRYNIIKKELEGINEEINIDKEKIIEIITKYNYPSEMADFLLQLDTIPESSEWSSINSGMIGNLRSFFEELIRNVAESIKKNVGDEFPSETGKGEMGNKRSYIKHHLELTDEDNKLITSYVNILHKEGGHSFISEKKYYRLTKNIGIEIAYFLLSKLDGFLEG